MPGIIKAGIPQPANQAAPTKPYFHLEDFEQRSEEYLERIRTHAAQIVSQAHRDAEKIRQDTITSAKKESLEIIRKEMQAELDRKLAQIQPMVNTTLAQMKQQLEIWRQEWESRTVQLATGIAEKICHHELQHRPEIVLSQIESALKLAGKEDRIEIRIHPNDSERFSPSINQIVELYCDLATTTLVPDPAVQIGGCILRTKYGDIDAQIQTQIDRIGEELS